MRLTEILQNITEAFVTCHRGTCGKYHYCTYSCKKKKTISPLFCFCSYLDPDQGVKNRRKLAEDRKVVKT